MDCVRKVNTFYEDPMWFDDCICNLCPSHVDCISFVNELTAE